jgi:hypothetical protein
MRLALVVPIVAAVLVGGASISAQQALGGLPAGRARAAAPDLTIPLWFPTAWQAKPTPRLLQRDKQEVRQKPEIVCGMTLIPADPNIDAAIRHAVPDNGPAYSIRAVNPTDCRR